MNADHEVYVESTGAQVPCPDAEEREREREREREWNKGWVLVSRDEDGFTFFKPYSPLATN